LVSQPSGLWTSSVQREPCQGMLERTAVRKRTVIGIAIYAALASLARVAYRVWRAQRARQEEIRRWRMRTEDDMVQACILSTEHLQELGRIEKRTLYVKPLTEVFLNQTLRDRVLWATTRCTPRSPSIFAHLTAAERKFVLKAVTNDVSQHFAPQHIFFNQAHWDHTKYRSAWYAATLTFSQSVGKGRFFCVSHKPVGYDDDIGAHRIRIEMVALAELAAVADGSLKPDRQFFSFRHQNRWENVSGMAQLYRKQEMRHSQKQSGAPEPAEDSDVDCLHKIHLPYPCRIGQEGHPSAARAAESFWSPKNSISSEASMTGDEQDRTREIFMNVIVDDA